MRRIKQHFKLAVASAWIGAISLLSTSTLSAIEDDSKRKCISVAVGVVFWVSLIFEQFMFWHSVSMRKKNSHSSKEKNNLSIGLISFFSTVKGMIADIALIMSLVALVGIIGSGNSTSKLIYALVAAIYLSLNLHCLYNGRHYRIISRSSRMNEVKAHENP